MPRRKAFDGLPDSVIADMTDDQVIEALHKESRITGKREVLFRQRINKMQGDVYVKAMSLLTHHAAIRPPTGIRYF